MTRSAPRHAATIVMALAIGTVACLAAGAELGLPAVSGDLPGTLRWLKILGPGAYDYDDYRQLTADGAVLACEGSDSSEIGRTIYTANSLVHNLATGKTTWVHTQGANHLSSWSPDEQLIPWAGDADGAHAAIGTIGRNGVTKTLLDAARLTRLSGLKLMGPTVGGWSPDGKWFLWGVHISGCWVDPADVTRPGTCPAVGLVSPDGRVPWVLNRKRLVAIVQTRKRCDEMRATWSPSGTKIAIMFVLRAPAARDQDQAAAEPGLLLLDVTGKVLNWRKLPPGSRFHEFSWSPDGRILVDARAEKDGNRTDVYDATTLTRRAEMQAFFAGWAGNAPILSRHLRDKTVAWWTLDLPALQPRALLETKPGDDVEFVDADTALVGVRKPSRLGRKHPYDPEFMSDLYLVKVATHERRLLSTDTFGCYTGVSHDRRFVAWVEDRGGSVGRFPAVQVLEVATGRKLTVAMPPREPYPHKFWAPTSNRLLVLGPGDTKRVLLIDLGQ